jgi:hypothetical protein
MPIIKQVQTPSGIAVGYHVFSRAEIIAGIATVLVTVKSWVNENNAVLLNNRSPAWEWVVSIPQTGLNFRNFDTAVEAALINDANSPFLAGSIVSSAATLDALRTRLWAKIKQKRDELEQGGFEWNGVTFDSDLISSARWQATVSRAARNTDPEWKVTWKLADNTFRDLSAADIIAIDNARFDRIVGIHRIANGLYTQIFDPAKTTAEEIQAVANWPQA